MSGAREAILSTIERSRHARLPRPAGRRPAFETDDLAGLFSERAMARRTQIAGIPSPDHAPFAVEILLKDEGAPPRLHVPAQSPLRALPWKNVPQLTLFGGRPGIDDSALAAADYAIAETGTLVFLSATDRPASWHFLPARAFVILSAVQIVPTLEHVLAAVKAKGMPSTLNLITGPSCTGDIEQSIEFGAHGPKQVHILLCD